MMKEQEGEQSRVAIVTGAAGFVGSHLCRELYAQGYQVRALHRPTSNLTSLQDLPIARVTGDVTDRRSLEAAFAGADVVFHIAALYREARFPDSEYFRVNAEGTRNVFEAALTCGVQRVVHCSTIGVHSHIEHPPADEREPYAPTDVYQESKVEGEKIALEYFRRGAIEGAVIRPAMIWGPGDTRFLKLFRGIARRRFPLIGAGTTMTHWILVTDLARAFRLADQVPAPNGEVYIIAGRRPVTLRHTCEQIAAELGTSLLPFSLPVWPIQAAGSVVEALCRPFGIEPPLHRRRADFFIKNRAFDCSKARNHLGFEAAQEFEQEVAQICAWYRSQGWL